MQASSSIRSVEIQRTSTNRGAISQTAQHAEVAEILDTENSLDSFLRSVRNSKIDIAVAFASKTGDLIRTMALNGNQITLIIGTINYFSDPAFIEYCWKLTKRYPIEFYVDFRENESIHWKLYLVAPATVIIGSSNLTTTGLSMGRDTVVCLRDAKLYQAYQLLLGKLKQNDQVVKSAVPEFAALLAKYKDHHRETVRRPLKRESVSDFVAWVAKPETHILPLYTWYSYTTEEDRQVFADKIAPKMTSEAETDGVQLIGCYEGEKNVQHYHNDEVILEMESSGILDSIKFCMVNRVTYNSGRWWLCNFDGNEFPKPFTLTDELRAIIKIKCEDWYKADKKYLDSTDLRELANLLQDQQPRQVISSSRIIRVGGTR
jgi:HKD family nuclease